MSDQNYYNNQGPPYGNQQGAQNLQSNNPFAHQQAQQPQQPQQQQQQPSYNTDAETYAPPPGPPPSHRSATFKESDFVPDTERGEQREAMEQFEMNRSQPESTDDRDVATLQEEFPSVDGSLIAALYGDSKSLSATREMLRELGSQQ